jgi:hypothetical protein
MPTALSPGIRLAVERMRWRRRFAPGQFRTPIATQLRGYWIALDAASQGYVDTLLRDADFLEWEQTCATDVWHQPGYPVIDDRYRL